MQPVWVFLGLVLTVCSLRVLFCGVLSLVFEAKGFLLHFLPFARVVSVLMVALAETLEGISATPVAQPEEVVVSVFFPPELEHLILQTEEGLRLT